VKGQSDSEWQPAEFPAVVITADGIGPLGGLVLVMFVLGAMVMNMEYTSQEEHADQPNQ